MSDLAPFQDSIQSILDRFVAFLPTLLLSILVIVGGWLVCRLLEAAARRLVTRLKFDSVMAEAGWSSALEQAGVKAKPSDLVGRLVFWSLMAVVVVLAVHTLGFEMSGFPLRGFFAYLPRILGVLLLLFIGSTVAVVLGTAVRTALARIRFAQSRLLAGAVRGLILMVTFIAAFELLGFDITFLTQTMINLITIFAAALALAFALGGREAVRNILAGYYAREQFRAGDYLHLGSEEGELVAIGTLTAELETDSGSLVIPNSRLTDQAVRRTSQVE